MTKVLFIASTGGHLNEIMKLSPLFKQYDALFVTEKDTTTQNLNLEIPIKYLKFGTRKHLFKYFFIFSFNILKSLLIFIQFKPDVVISTGAHTSVPMLLIASIFKKKTLYIESIARVNSKSMTGKIVSKHVDKLFVQWEEMQEIYPSAEFHGRLL